MDVRANKGIKSEGVSLSEILIYAALESFKVRWDVKNDLSLTSNDCADSPAIMKEGLTVDKD